MRDDWEILALRHGDFTLKLGKDCLGRNRRWLLRDAMLAILGGKTAGIFPLAEATRNVG